MALNILVWVGYGLCFLSLVCAGYIIPMLIKGFKDAKRRRRYHALTVRRMMLHLAVKEARYWAGVSADELETWHDRFIADNKKFGGCK